LEIKVIIFLLLSYFVGAIPTGFIAFKIRYKKDIREVGSGNIGFANVLRTAGPVLGGIVLLCDAGKAFTATYFFSHFFPSVTLFKIIFGIAVITGNILNPFLRFKGGKGVGAALGVTLAIAPCATIGGLIVFTITVLLSRYISLGSISAITVYTFLSFIFYRLGSSSGEHKIELFSTEAFGRGEAYSFYFSLILFILIVIRHISNIKRLIKGEENKIEFRKKQ